jgi:hypothetical protein
MGFRLLKIPIGTGTPVQVAKLMGSAMP